MTVPAFSVAVRNSQRSSVFRPAALALAATMFATLLAVLSFLFASWSRAGWELTFGLGVIATAAAPALATILHGLDAKAASRVLAGGAMAAPSIAIYYLFEDPQLSFIGDGVMALTLGALGGAMALFCRHAERSHGLWGWWLGATPSLGMLWIISAHLRPAQVWVEMPAW